MGWNTYFPSPLSTGKYWLYFQLPEPLYHCTAHTGAVPLYCTNKCCTTVLHTQVLYHYTANTDAVPPYCTHRCCTTVLHTQVLYHCTAHTGAEHTHTGGSMGFSAESTWIQQSHHDTISRTVSAKLINIRSDHIWYKPSIHTTTRSI